MPVDLQSLLMGLNFDQGGGAPAEAVAQAPEAGLSPALKNALMQRMAGQGLDFAQGQLLGGNALAARQAQFQKMMGGLNPPRPMGAPKKVRVPGRMPWMPPRT